MPARLGAVVMAVLGMISLFGCVKANAPILETTADNPATNPVDNRTATAPTTPPTGEAQTTKPETTKPETTKPEIAQPTRRGPLQPNGEVVHVVDGDTVDVRFADTGTRERVRLIGIDTPESKRPNTPVECFASLAAEALTSLIPKGTKIRVEPDVELRDRYGRYLGYVYRSQDGLFVNLEMARVGMAVPLTFPPNVAFAAEFVAAGDAARAANIGLWTACESAHTPDTTPSKSNATTTP